MFLIFNLARVSSGFSLRKDFRFQVEKTTNKPKFLGCSKKLNMKASNMAEI